MSAVRPAPQDDWDSRRGKGKASLQIGSARLPVIYSGVVAQQSTEAVEADLTVIGSKHCHHI